MQIQKGLVKYKDRSDINCKYGILEDGKQFYFLEGGELSNGSFIASTVLVEAIDPMVNASSIGVIDANGNIIIPFSNKSIKVILDKYLFVESAKPTSENVIEAVKLRSDPLAATKLVSTAASIKDKINARLDSRGRFIFNDQFSEGSLFDFDGNNVVSDMLFSFIAVIDDKLFLSQNLGDSSLYEFTEKDGLINLTELEEKEKIEKERLNNSLKIAEDKTLNELENSIKLPSVPLDINNTDITTEDIDNALDQDNDFLDNKPLSLNLGDNINYNDTSKSYNEDNSEEVSQQKDDDDFYTEESDSVFNDINGDNLLDESNIGISFDEEQSNFIDSVTNTINNLVNTIKKQRDTIEFYEDKLKKAASLNKRVVDKFKNQSREVDSFNDYVRNTEEVISGLESKIASMDDKIKEQEETIIRQYEELDSLKSQLNGRADLAKALEDANNLLNHEI